MDLPCLSKAILKPTFKIERMLPPFRRTINRYEEDRYEEDGLDGLVDKRLAQDSHRRAPVDEVMRLVDRYRNRRQGWNVKHYTA